MWVVDGLFVGVLGAKGGVLGAKGGVLRLIVRYFSRFGSFTWWPQSTMKYPPATEWADGVMLKKRFLNLKLHVGVLL